MKLTKNPFALSDTITTDDGVIIGVIYYNNQPIDDTGRKAPEVFREWFELNKIVTVVQKERHDKQEK